ncbi:MAG: hypothetical protein U0Q16_06550 [Bryobacteraceae bacterium]
MAMLAAARLAASPLTPEHARALDRRRRICVQLDAADHRHVKLAPAEWLDYVFGFASEAGTQIDSIWLDIGMGEVAVYPSTFLEPCMDEQLVRWRTAGFEWASALIGGCRKRGLEVFWNHRFSEVDISPSGGLEMERRSPWKAKHPDWVLKTWWWQGLWNAASAGLRAHKVEVLREIAETLDLDGFQIDFARHVPCLPVGRQWELRGEVTEFLRMTRRMLLDVARKRGKPYLLAAKVPETLAGCRADGFDVATWAREELVDILTLGSRTMYVDVEEFRRVVGKRIKLTPCLDDHHATDGYRYPPIEFYRGVFTNWLAQGADSVTTFNWAVSRREFAAKVGGQVAPDAQAEAYHEAGSLATMAGKSKIFAVERRGGYPWAEGYFNRNDGAPLPVKLANDGRAFRTAIRVFERNPGRVTLRLVMFQTRRTDRVEVTWNGAALGAGEASDWKDPQIFSPKPQPNSGGKGEYPVDPAQKLLRIDYTIPAGAVRYGANEVGVRLAGREVYRPGEDVQVEKIEVHTEP